MALIVFSRSNFLYQKVTNAGPASWPDFLPNSLACSSVARAKRSFNKPLDMVMSPNLSARTSYSTYLLSALLARTFTLTLSFSERACKLSMVSWSSLNERVSEGRPLLRCCAENDAVSRLDPVACYYYLSTSSNVRMT